jgi:hypothetical protein
MVVDKSMAHNDCGLSSPFEDAEEERIGHFLLPQRADPQWPAMVAFFCTHIYIVLADRCTLTL